MAGKILVGTASWTDHVPFYPPEVKGTARLTWYAQHFPYVEIDSSFYHVPKAKTTAGWAESTPADFVMGIKAHKSMTLHERKDGIPQPASDKLIGWFEEALVPLRESGKLGTILYQWPPWFKPTPASFDELVKTRERHPDDQVAIEFRNRAWAEPEIWDRVIDLLSEARLTYCCVDEPQHGSGTMPFLVTTTTPELALVRLHGRNKEAWYKKVEKTGHRFDYFYSPTELAEIAENVRLLSEAAAAVHVAVNTNNGAQGPVNALALAQALELPTQNPEMLADLRLAADRSGQE
ncbi:MAG TPA: DUF72 domain-containing protein [Candidatus Dormibacteraeota bacterium]|nr:DUF72 domain-containing protein [Candidatus Dormibacteraeota bacterium]